MSGLIDAIVLLKQEIKKLKEKINEIENPVVPVYVYPDSVTEGFI